MGSWLREKVPDQGSMRASISVVKSSTTQEQQKAAPLCFSFSTEYRVSRSGSTKRRDSLLVCFPFSLEEQQRHTSNLNHHDKNTLL